MKKIFLIGIALLLLQSSMKAQVELAKMLGKNSGNYKLGFGAFLKLAYPVSDAADITLEGGALLFSEKEGSGSGISFVPVKLGYRHTFNGSGTGFYAEPSVGYNVYGINSHNVAGYNVDEKFNGIILAAGAGYLFPSLGGIQFDLSMYYQSVLNKGNPVNCIGLRLSHNFSFNRRETEY